MERYFSQGLAASTRRVYSTGIKKFNQFCNQYSMSPFPSNEALLCKFVAFLAVCCNTIKVYLAAVRQLNIQQGHAPPDISQMPRLHQVLRGIKVVSGSAQAASKRPERLPITPSILRAIKTHWESQPLTKDRIMFWVHSPHASLASCVLGRYALVVSSCPIHSR